MAHIEVGRQVLMNFYEMIEDLVKLERAPKMEGRRLTMLLASKVVPQPKPPPKPEGGAGKLPKVTPPPKSDGGAAKKPALASIEIAEPAKPAAPHEVAPSSEASTASGTETPVAPAKPPEAAAAPQEADIPPPEAPAPEPAEPAAKPDAASGTP